MRISYSTLTLRSVIACAALVVLVTGCDDRKPNSRPIAASSPGTNASPPADQWLGKWIGPEGTFLQIAGGGGQYELTIQNLDGPRTFHGRAAGDQITFERDGIEEHIHATNGAETGMKWLSEKSDCLTVRAGEGYCRD
jgi:hypothetical protein